MQYKSSSSLNLLRSSSKLLELTRGKLEIEQEKAKKFSQSARLPPLAQKPKVETKPKPQKKKKLRNFLKCRQVNLGTVSIIKQESVKNKSILRKHITNSTRSKLKIKTIHWLISNYREEVDKLLDNCRLLIQSTNYRGHISHQNFEDLMTSLGLGTDKTLVERLFWVFDEDGDGKIEPKEIMVGLEMFRETNFKEKLEVFFDICDEDGSGDIDEEEFFNVLKLCVTSAKERKLLKDSLHDLFIAIDEDGNGVLTKDEIVKAAAQSEAVKTIIEKSITTIHGVDTWIANDFYNGVNLQHISGIGHRENGISLMELAKIKSVFEDEEKKYEQDCKRKKENLEKLQYWKIENGHDFSFEENHKEVIYGADGNIIDY